MADENKIPDLESLERRPRPNTPGSEPDREVVHDRVRRAAAIAVDLKADEVKILDMRGLVTYTDYLLVCTGRNVRLTKRIAEDIGFKLKEDAGLLPRGSEGTSNGDWILLDFLDFVVHIFTPEAREFYRLDTLWKQAPVELIG